MFGSPAQPTATRGVLTLVAVASLVLIVLGLRQFGGSLAPFVLGLILIIVAQPVQEFLARRGAPGWLALAALLITAYGILVLFMVAIAWAAARLVDYLASADYSDQLASLQEDVRELLLRLGASEEDLNSAADAIDLGAVAGYLVQSLSGVVGIVAVFGVVLLSMLFIGLDASRFGATLRESVERDRPLLAAALRDFASGTRRYFAVNTLFGLLVAVLQVIFLLMVGIPLAFVWGLLSLITSYIPNVGFVIAIVPPILIAFLEDGLATAIVVAIGFTAINQIVDGAVKPKVVGDAVGLSATLTFGSLIFWAWVFGPIGALLAVPLTLLAKAVLVDANPDARWLSPLISLEPESDTPSPPSPTGGGSNQ